MSIFDSLLTDSQASRVDPELLEMLGHKAAQMFQNGVPLNKAIPQLLAQHPQLGNEHVKRVVEFANNATFQDLFQKSEDKNIHFDVADPGVVLRDLKDGGSPAHDGKTMAGGLGDYHAPPQDKGMGSDVEQAFESQFNPSGPAEQEKNAEAHSHHTDRIEDLYEVHTRLQASQEKLAEAHETFVNILSDAKEDFYQAVKHEVLSSEGAGLGGVVGALEKAASSSLVSEMLVPVVEKLAEEVGPSKLNLSMNKLAGQVVNYAHPLLRSWAGIVKAAQEVVRSRIALSQVSNYLDKTAGALTSAVKKRVGVRGPVPGGLRQRSSRK